MKRKLALFLSAAMATSCLPMTAYAANFKDINEVAWATTVINNAADKGLLSGYEDGTFRGKNNVTYCEAMVMVYNSLMKTGAATAMNAVDAYSYMSVLNTYKVPSWCQTAVAYGLHHNIIDMQMVASKFAGGTQKATREDVALMFGNALAVRYDVDGATPDAVSFKDYWKISANAVIQVDLLKRLGILSGDEYGSFNPKNNITRAEMAVMLNNTYEVLTQGIGNTGVIKDITNNAGTYYYIEVEMDNGYVEGFHATADKVKVYVGETNQEMALSRVSKGDRISVIHNGGALSAIRVLDAVPAQAKYDITGYITSMKDNTVSLENENTGETDKYGLDSDCVCYLEGVKVTRKVLRDTLEARYTEHAYAGVMTEVKLEKVGSSREEVTYVTEMHVTFTDEYTMTGTVDSFNSSRVTFKPTGSSTKKDVKFASGCAFYIADNKVSVTDMVKLAESGTTYVQVTVDKKGEAVKVILSEDSFDGGSKSSTTTYEVVSFTDSKMVVKSGGKETTYRFGSENPTKNITFYKWDNSEKEFTDVKISAAESYYDTEEDEGRTVYCRIEFNSGGKISAVELSSRKSAWKDDEDSYSERKGTVASVENGKLKFKTSSTVYNMLTKYNADYKENDDDLVTGTGPDGYTTVRNPLIVKSAWTSSLKVFERMANDNAVELYAEISADGENNVVKVDSWLTAATGKLVEYDRDDKYMIIETKNGNQFKLNATRNPKLTDEDDDFTLDDIASVGYIGSTLDLGFSSEGLINKITVTDSTYGNGIKRVKGVATSGKDGLKVQGDSNTYEWLSRSRIEIKNHSSQSTDLEKLKAMIDDKAVEVYVEARLDEKDRVESINVYVKKAEGELKEYDADDDIIRIETASGNTFSFDCIGKPSCNVNGVDRDKLDDKCRGKNVKLTFNDDGWVSKIEG
ncbi:MAG: S-layer homology domain-containing protein [Anaerotignum sp.]